MWTQQLQQLQPIMAANMLKIILLCCALVSLGKSKRCQQPNHGKFPDNMFHTCRDQYCSGCPLNFQRCHMDANQENGDCKICMNSNQLHYMSRYQVQQCSRRRPSKVIVMLTTELTAGFRMGDFRPTWENWQMTAMISNVMQYGGYILFRAQNTLGFICQKSFQSCNGDPKAKESDFAENQDLMRQLGDCMQCSLTKVPSSVTNHCTHESVMSNKAINTVWENGGMSQCNMGGEVNCKCKDNFKACDILIDIQNENTQCTYILKVKRSAEKAR